MACHLHSIGFYKPQAKAVNCMSLDPCDKKLALSRNDASIEVWDVAHSPYLLWCIPGVTSGSIEALSWLGSRLFSTGLSGALIEWDLKSLRIKKSILVTGHGAWCIDVYAKNDQALIAVGTEQGFINLFSSSIKSGDIHYEKLFDKQEGRVMCCKFSKPGDLLVTGSSDCVRLWSVASGQALKKMTPSRRNKNVETIIWSLVVLSDLTIITGDSCGRLSFWDGTIGEQCETFTTHRADILTLCVSEDENNVYAAGVDPLVVSLSSVFLKTRQWVRGVQRNIHRHDVRSLIIHEDRLISAGVDGYVAISSFPPRQLFRYPPLHLKQCVSLCPEPRLVMLKYSSYVDIWRLGSPSSTFSQQYLSKCKGNVGENEKTLDTIEQDTGINGDYPSDVHLYKPLKSHSQPVKLLTLHAKNDDQLLCCSISIDGIYIAYSTDNVLKIFKFSVGDNDANPSLSRILLPLQNTKFNSCHYMTFTHDCHSLITATANGIISVIQIDAAGIAEVIQSIDAEKELRDGTIQLLGVSAAHHIIAANSSGGVEVWNRKQNGNIYEKFTSLPNYRCTASALSATPEGKSVIVAYVDHKIIEYDLKSQRVTWTANLIRISPIIGLTFDPRNNNMIFAYDQSSVWVINKKTILKDKAKVSTVGSKGSFSFTVLKYKHAAFFSWLVGMEAVLVEVSPESLAASLPAAFALKRFGAQ